MKKILCFIVLANVCLGIYAFDRSLNGSWGLIMNEQKNEFIRFSNNEIFIMNTLYRSSDFSEADDTIYIDNFGGDSIIIQYYRLASNKLLFILWNTDDPTQSITLILSKL